MEVLLIVLGIAVLATVAFDALRTTTSPGSGGGPITTRITAGLWSLSLSLHRRHPSHTLLTRVGTSLLLMTFLVWVMLTWLGWTLVFRGVGSLVMNDGTPAGPADTVWFAASTLFTLGLGDVTPHAADSKILTAVATFTGLFVVTLGVTYFVPVVSAVTRRRQVATHISSLGHTVDDVVTQACDGTDAFVAHVANIVPTLTLVAQEHLAYPVLHYFHSTARDAALAPSVAVLDEALTVLEHGTEESVDSGAVRPARAAVGHLLETLGSAFVAPAPASPLPPPLDALEEAGIATTERDKFTHHLADTDHRRRLLLALVEADGWSWDDVGAARR